MPEFLCRFSSPIAELRAGINERKTSFIAMSSLLKVYGTCLIPKGTILLRSNTTVHPKQIFFALHSKVAADYNDYGDDRIQAWKVLSDIEVLFMVSGIRDSRAWIKSSITEIYCNYFPNDICKPDGFYLLEIKYYDKQKLSRLIDKMKEENINGWFSSIQDKVEPEICLFDTTKIKLLEMVDKKGKYLHYNALKKLKIIPSDTFYKNSQEFTRDFSQHLKWYKGVVKSAAEFGQTSEETKYEYFNLRLKLKI